MRVPYICTKCSELHWQQPVDSVPIGCWPGSPDSARMQYLFDMRMLRARFALVARSPKTSASAFLATQGDMGKQHGIEVGCAAAPLLFVFLLCGFMGPGLLQDNYISQNRFNTAYMQFVMCTFQVSLQSHILFSKLSALLPTGATVPLSARASAVCRLCNMRLRSLH